MGTGFLFGVIKNVLELDGDAAAPAAKNREKSY